MRVGDTVYFLAGNNEIHPATIINIDSPEQVDLLAYVSAKGDSAVIIQRIDNVVRDGGCATADSWHWPEESLGPSIGVGIPQLPAKDRVAELEAQVAAMTKMFQNLLPSGAPQPTNAEVVPPPPPTPTNTGTGFVPPNV